MSLYIYICTHVSISTHIYVHVHASTCVTVGNERFVYLDGFVLRHRQSRVSAPQNGRVSQYWHRHIYTYHSPEKTCLRPPNIVANAWFMSFLQCSGSTQTSNRAPMGPNELCAYSRCLHHCPHAYIFYQNDVGDSL